MIFMDEVLAQKSNPLCNYSFSVNLLKMSHVPSASDEPGGGDKPSDDKRKEQTTPVVSPSQGSPEAKEERYERLCSNTMNGQRAQKVFVVSLYKLKPKKYLKSFFLHAARFM